MQTQIDKELKSVVRLLDEMTNAGTMEQGQRDAVANAVKELRKAAREQNSEKLKKALTKVAVLFVKKFG